MGISLHQVLDPGMLEVLLGQIGTSNRLLPALLLKSLDLIVALAGGQTKLTVASLSAAPVLLVVASQGAALL